MYGVHTNREEHRQRGGIYATMNLLLSTEVMRAARDAVTNKENDNYGNTDSRPFHMGTGARTQ